MKKIAYLLMVVFLSFALVFIVPYKQAHALGPVIAAEAAVPVGITIGAGAYTLGALGLAALVGVAGYDTYSEEINAHALQTWENGTQLSKNAMNLMIQANVNMANGAVAMGTDFINWMESNSGGLQGIEQYLLSTQQNNFNYGATTRGSYSGEIALEAKHTLSGATVLIGGVATASTISISVQTHDNAQYRYIQVKSGTNLVYDKSGAATPKSQTDAVLAMIKNYASLTTADMMAIIKFLGITSTITATTATPELVNYTDGVSKVREAWQDMKDAGLVLPVDSAIPVYQGNIAAYNPTSDVYTGVDGGVITKGDLTWSFPQPRIRTGEELDVTVPPGVYVDNPAGVYTPSLPTTAVPDIAIPTTTSITTGVTTTIPKTTTGEPPPTGGTTPTPKGEPVNPFNAKPIPIAALTGLFQLLAALIFYLIRMFTFIATIAFIAPTPIDNPYFLWFTTATFQGITPFPLVRNLALFFLGFSIYKSVRRVFG